MQSSLKLRSEQWGAGTLTGWPRREWHATLTGANLSEPMCLWGQVRRVAPY